jgi:hypothetical protein
LGDRPPDPGGEPTGGRGPDDRHSGLVAELARLEKAIAEMAATTIKLDSDRKDIAGQIQVAQHRRDVLRHAIAERERAAGRAGGRAAARERRLPRQPARRTAPPADPTTTAGPAVAARPRVEPLAAEASSSSVQTIMLGLGALLLGVAAVVFVGVAITELDPWTQLVILLATTTAFLAVALPVTYRGLTATAETLAAVGLLISSVAGYPLWSTGLVSGVPGPVFGGLVSATTAALGYGHHRLSGLAAPKWAGLLALQPVLPLVAYPVVSGPAAWALVFTLVAAHNAVVVTVVRAGSDRWFGYLGFALHGAALAVATGFAATGLVLAGTVTAALPSGLTLVLAAAVGLAGALGMRRDPLPQLAAGALTLAVTIVSVRLVALALPGRALLPIAAVVTAVALAPLLLPRPARRGPQLAAVAALAVLGAVVAGLCLRAGAAALVLPPWPDDLAGHQRGLAAAAGTVGWQLAATAAALAVGAGLAMPAAARRESAVAGVALAALATPASLGLDPAIGAWVLAVVAAGLIMAGLDARTGRAAAVHVAGAAVVGLAGAGASLAGPALTAAILAALTVTGAVVAGARPRVEAARPVTEWAAGGATLALPGAVATGAVAAGIGTQGVLGAAFAAVCGSLSYAAATQLRRRYVPLTVRAGVLASAVVVAATAVLAPGATGADQAIAVLLAVSAGLVFATTRIDASRRPDRPLDGADIAAAAVTAGVLATLARLAGLVLPITGTDAVLTTGAVLVLGLALAIRALPEHWRPGPVLGVSLAGVVVVTAAGTAAVISGARVIATVDHIWAARLGPPPPAEAFGLTWSAPLALAMLSVAAVVALPRPASHYAGAVLAVLATVGAPVALGLPWWLPSALAAVVGAGYAVAAVRLPARVAAGWAVMAPVPGRPAGQAALARAGAAGTLALYAVAASAVRPWLTAAVLGSVALVGAAVAVLAAEPAAEPEHSPAAGPPLQARTPAAGPSVPERPPAAGPLVPEPDPLSRIGGTAAAGALLAVPAGLAGLAVHLGRSAEVALSAALAGVTLGLVLVALLRPVTPAAYLPYGTVGVAAGATGAALATVPTPLPTGVYAAAAVLLAVLAELVRAAAPGPGPTRVNPAPGAVFAAAVPAAVALVAVAPSLTAALVDPYQVVFAPWQGAPPGLTDPAGARPTSVLAALLLTLAAALAAVGFGGRVTRQAVPVVAPGLAVTLLISPAALGAPWPASTVAALAVFTMAVLGVALTPPPPGDRAARPLRVTRQVVLGIGLAAGGAGLAGSLAEVVLTWATFGGAVAVGAAAATGGRTRTARLLGWLGAAAAAQLFALTSGYLLGVTWPQAGFGLLAVSAVGLLVVVRLARLRRPEAAREAVVVEWTGGYVPLLLAVMLAAGSAPDLAALLVGAGAVLGLAALKSGLTHRRRRVLLWSAALSEVAAWSILMRQFDVGMLEAYTLPFAGFALLVGALEVRYRPELGSWVTYGPGLVAALGPSLVVVVATTTPQPARQAWVLLAGVAALIAGSRLGQRAPLIIGSVVTAAAALHLLSLAGPWLLLIPIGVLLLILGANRERRQRDLERIRGAYSRMR